MSSRFNKNRDIGLLDNDLDTNRTVLKGELLNSSI